MKPQVLTTTRSAARVARRHLVALGAQAREDALGIDQCLGTAKADEAHFGAFAFDGFHAAFKTVAGRGRDCTPTAAGLPFCGR